MKPKPRYKLNSTASQEILHFYSEGVPQYIVARDYGVSPKTVRRLIREYELTHEPLRSQKIIREKKRK